MQALSLGMCPAKEGEGYLGPGWGWDVREIG